MIDRVRRTNIKSSARPAMARAALF